MAAGVDVADPRTWPLGDVLPLVRRRPGEPFPELGLLLAFRGRASSVVYLTGAFEPGLCRRLETCDRELHLTFESIPEAGWAVD